MLGRAEKWLVLFALNCLLVASIVSLYVIAYILALSYLFFEFMVELGAVMEGW